MAYGIKAGYVDQAPAYYLDDAYAARGVTYQPDVYALAALLVEHVPGLRHLVDVGCGAADKLDGIHARHPSWQFTGLDYGPNLAHCRAAYPWGLWLEVDLEAPPELPLDDAVVVFADVIEHLTDPGPALLALRDSKAHAVVLSTPERDLHHGEAHAGPPPNPCHVREWNAAELHGYLEGLGFTIAHHGLTRTSDEGFAMGTQLVVMR